MPDRFGFEHLPDWGVTSHRCIDCGWPAGKQFVSEEDRAGHYKHHQLERAQRKKKQQRAAATHARKMKTLAKRENTKAYD